MREAQHSRGKLVDTGRIFRSTPGSSQSGVEGIKGHRLLRTISSGGASSVYLTENDSAAERIVLKVLKQVPDEIDGEHVFDRFIQEYELIAGIQHPNIVRIFDLGIADDHAFIAMEYFSAGDLKSRIQSGLKPGRILEYLRQITDALGVIHEVEVLHRDLKPGNIMFREDGSLGLIDFGLAKEMRLKAAITGTGQIFGTPYYMSPEQGHAGKVDQRSDIYSLGVIFYEMLTGMKPFRGSSPMGVIYKHSHAARPSLPHRLGEYQPLLEQMLAVAPQDRFQSAGELRTALN